MIVMYLLYLISFLPSSISILVSPETRLSMRNLTCQHGTSSSMVMSFNCEACLITLRNYMVNTTLSLTGSGSAGLTYTCVRLDDVEAYHENLVRECRYFPREALNGHDDFCVATPYSQVRGSYRACICLNNLCNQNYTQCSRPLDPSRNRLSIGFKKLVMPLTRHVECYQSEIDDAPADYSSLTPICSVDDELCHRYLTDHSVLCAISVGRNNRITRLSLPPTLYSAYVLKYRMNRCQSFSSTPERIVFSNCDQEETVCMCIEDQCNSELSTCEINHALQMSYSKIMTIFFVYKTFLI